MRNLSRFMALILVLASACTPAYSESSPAGVWDAYSTYKILVEADGDQVRLTGDSKAILEVDGLKFKDLNGNGMLDIYEDWRLEPDARTEDLLSQMTLDEKSGLLFFSGLAGQNGSTTQVLMNNEVIWTGDEDYPLVDSTAYSNVTKQINEYFINTMIFAESGTPHEQLQVLFYRKMVFFQYSDCAEQIRHGDRMKTTAAMSVQRNISTSVYVRITDRKRISRRPEIYSSRG